MDYSHSCMVFKDKHIRVWSDLITAFHCPKNCYGISYANMRRAVKLLTWSAGI